MYKANPFIGWTSISNSQAGGEAALGRMTSAGAFGKYTHGDPVVLGLESRVYAVPAVACVRAA